MAMLFGFMVLIQIGFNAPFIAVGASILFHRLFNIDVILSRTLTWLAMTGVVIGAYIGIVVGIGRLLDTERSLVLSLLATGLVGGRVPAVRARVQRAVDCFIYGERDDPYAVLSRLGHRIEDTLGAADLLPQIVRTTAEALRCLTRRSSSTAPVGQSWLPSPEPRRCRRYACRSPIRASHSARWR
jgi:hypothetical protein